jgi:CRP-like cAMP-binding protein
VARVAAWLLDAAPGEMGALPRHVVAELLGMQPETLSRALAALAEAGAIEVTRRRIDVRDHAALEDAAHGSLRATARPAG